MAESNTKESQVESNSVRSSASFHSDISFLAHQNKTKKKYTTGFQGESIARKQSFPRRKICRCDRVLHNRSRQLGPNFSFHLQQQIRWFVSFFEKIKKKNQKNLSYPSSLLFRAAYYKIGDYINAYKDAVEVVQLKQEWPKVCLKLFFFFCLFFAF